jgi:3-oxoadipate enol-lactonase
MTLTMIGGRTVEYEIGGSGASAVIFCSPTWWPLDAWALHGLAEVGQSFRAIAFNQRGVGRSSGRGEHYGVAMFAADTLALLDHLEIDSACLVGFAIGTAVAMTIARDYPKRVWGLVLGAVSAGAPADAEDPRLAVAADIAARGFEGHIRHHALNDSYGFNPETFRRDSDRPQRLADALWRNGATPEEYLKHVDARRGYSAFDGADRIGQPALLVVGEEDAASRGASTPLAATRKLAGVMPQAGLVVVPGVRHMIFWEKPAQVWPPVLAFLARNAPGQ